MSRNIRGTQVAKRFKLPYDLAVPENYNRVSNETQAQIKELSKKIQENPYGMCILRYANQIQQLILFAYSRITEHSAAKVHFSRKNNA